MDALLDAVVGKNVELWIDGDTVAFEERTESLSQEELELLDQWNRQLLNRLSEPGYVLRSFPLSRGQQGLLYLHQLMPKSASYHMAFPVRIHSDVDQEALQRALQTLVNRHSCLRTVFKRRHTGGPIQHILAFKELTLERIDCTGMNETDLKAAVAGRYAEPFDLETEIPVRAHLFARSPDDHVFLLNIHHIVTDGLSLWTLLADLRDAYAAEVIGGAVGFRPLGPSYAEFVSREEEMLEGSAGKETLAFWKTYLEGAPAFLDFPTDRKRPPLPSGNGELTMFKLDAALLDRLEDFAQGKGIKLRTILLAAYQVLLHRYSGQDDLLIAFETAGRPGFRFARTAGYFVNPIVYRSSFDGEWSSVDYLRHHEEELATLLEHQSMPFVHLVEQLPFDRDPRYWPLVQVEFNFIRLPRRPGFEDLMTYVDEPHRADFGGLTVSSYGLTQQVGQYDLSLTISQVRDEYWGGIKSSTDLFDSQDVSRMIEHYTAILGNIVNQSEDPVGRLSLMTGAEADGFLAQSLRAVEHEDWPPVHSLFEIQVAKSPDATAVVCDGSSVTYHDLNDRSDRLAQELAALGVGRDIVVGVCLDRSISMVEALLAILKVGGAYAPLDPGLPASRLAFMVRDAEIGVILTESGLSDGLPGDSAQLINLDAPRERRSTPDGSMGSGDEPTDSVAYVVYTSGSTGKPKGVEVTHRALSNLLQSVRKRPGLTSSDVLLAVTTLSFDIATMEILLPLIVGAKVVIALDEDTHDGRRLATMIKSHDITFMQATPATWRLLVNAGWEGQTGMKAVSGGEVLTPALAEQLLARLGSLWNGYGPSEATIYATFHEVARGEDPVPIGSPIDNTAAYVLDDHLQPVPAGLVGELYIGGVGLARGYANRESLTAERFIADPFSPMPEARMYMTGDRVRLRSNGELEFLGRSDHQVKIRGFRIELGEIDVTLEHHPAVKQAVATTAVDDRGNKRLVGCVVPVGTQPTVGEMRDFLRRHLPVYMIPSVWLFLDSLPLTPNGKVDRQALAAIRPTRPDSGDDIRPPTTEVEKQLEQLWRSMLGVDRIDIHDHFYDIGGDSITLAEMVVRASEMLGVDLPLSLAVEHQSIHALAGVIEAERGRGDLARTAPAGKTGREKTGEPPVRGRRKLSRSMLQPVMLAVLRLFVRATTQVVVAGEEHLAAAGPRLMASNHINWLDFPLMAAVVSHRVRSREHPSFVVAYRWKKWFHWVFAQFGHPIYVRRGQGGLEALEEIRAVLRREGLVGIAPEGTFDRGKLIAGKTGAARVASDTGAPILPVVIYGQDRALESWRRLRRVPITVRFGSPIWVRRGLIDQVELQRETDTVMEAIARLLPPERRGVYGYVDDRSVDPS